MLLMFSLLIIVIFSVRYDSSIDLLHQYKFSSQMTDDKIARAIYHTLCIEVALAGGEYSLSAPLKCILEQNLI